jgi:hypothetical protein
MSTAGAAARHRSEPHATGLDMTDHDRVETLYIAYERNGGVAICDEVVVMLRRHIRQPVSCLARWIVHRAIVNFHLHGHTFIPLFQFDLFDMSIKTTFSLVTTELSDVLDESELAEWFARPNCWLGCRSPIERLAQAPGAVLDAARADRYILRA